MCRAAKRPLHAHCAGLQLATEQLPVVGDSKMQADVHMLLVACQSAGADAWLLPLSLLLEDTNSLAGTVGCTVGHIHATVCMHLQAGCMQFSCILQAGLYKKAHLQVY